MSGINLGKLLDAINNNNVVIRIANLHRGIVKWYNDGLQNRSWEFDSLCPC